MAGAHQIGLYRQDHFAAGGIECLGLQPVAVGRHGLGHRLVEELQWRGQRRFQHDDTVDGNVAKLPHGI